MNIYDLQLDDLFRTIEDEDDRIDAISDAYTCAICDGEGISNQESACYGCSGNGEHRCKSCTSDQGSGDPTPCADCNSTRFVLCEDCDSTGVDQNESPCDHCHEGQIEILSNWAYGLDMMVSEITAENHQFAQENGYALFPVDDRVYIVKMGYGFSDDLRRLYVMYKVSGNIPTIHLMDSRIGAETLPYIPVNEQIELMDFIAHQANMLRFRAKQMSITAQRLQAKLITESSGLESPKTENKK